ncbi:hypothetical protein P5G51_004525 [Virgibacillus sp. 179-BFC.A HS]|uniref:Glucosidase YgjK N-terminal domain-containing protein n=1 Tax=Tigheibacillus jepli TaxID=3035914 RepID=A0ABU5CEK5_9BACI|nr:hypothetical protein [Virgibacillus sp. 179-BFC.A HS]MDY0404764.1 hypothetical protein [Virgibacillus sp. 179-BFC.A HS]
MGKRSKNLFVGLCLLLMACAVFGCESKDDSTSKHERGGPDRESHQIARTNVDQFANVLDLSANPTEEVNGLYDTNKYNHFSDLGAWHGYYQPDKNNKKLLGGFAGPLIVGEEYPVNLSDSINRIQITNKQTKEQYDLSKSKYIDFSSFPGRLEQKYVLDDFTLQLSLIFVSNRSALIRTEIENNSKEPLKLDISWKGAVFYSVMDGENKIDIRTGLQKDGNGIQVNFGKVREKWSYLATDEVKYTISRDKKIDTKINGRNYTSSLKDSVNIEPGGTFETSSTESYTFTKDEFSKEKAKLPDYIEEQESYFKENKKRWQGYLDKTFTGKKIKDFPEYQNAAVKSIETLITNWQSLLVPSSMTGSSLPCPINGLWACGAGTHGKQMSHWLIFIRNWRKTICAPCLIIKSNLMMTSDHRIKGRLLTRFSTIRIAPAAEKAETGMNGIPSLHCRLGQFGKFTRKQMTRSF